MCSVPLYPRIFCLALFVTIYLQQCSDWLCNCQSRLSSAGTVQQLLTDVLLICFCWSDDLVTQLEENDVILGWSQVSTLEQPHNQNLLTHPDLELGFPQKRRLSKAIGCHWLDWYQSIGTLVTFIYKPHGSELVWTWVDLVPAHSHGSIPPPLSSPPPPLLMRMVVVLRSKLPTEYIF